MSDSDIDELKAAKEKLTNSAQALFTKMYENMQQAQGGPAPDMNMGNMGGAAGAQQAGPEDNADDVVDGDYREV
jgi:molecular chaperone DnaK